MHHLLQNTNLINIVVFLGDGYFPSREKNKRHVSDLNMNILLITPSKEGQVIDYTTPTFFRNDSVKYMPLGILAVAAGISSTHKVEILDAASLNLSIDETVKEIKRIKPDVLGISTVTHKAYPMAEILRRVDGPIITVGGPHTTHYAKEIIAQGADAVFKHHADRNFDIWLNDGCKNGIYEDYITDIDSLPFPKRELLNINDYAIEEDKANETLFKTSGTRLPMMSSRGCPFRCVYCDVQEKKYQGRGPVSVVNEMEHILSQGASSVHILDDNFNVNRKRVLGICEEITKRNLKFNWSARGRADIDDETARALKEAGCNRLHVGVESLDPDVLEWMNKDQNVDAIKNFFDVCAKYGIETVPYFIVGTPVETREYRKKLPDKIRELGATYPFFNILYPASNTKYYEMLLEDGTFERDYWQDFVENPIPDFEMPLPRTHELQEELQATVRAYLNVFYDEV